MACRPLLLSVLISFISASVCLDAYAFDVIDESVYFPSVVQGHHGNNNNVCHNINAPQFIQSDTARINGTLGDDLHFCSDNTGMGLPSDGCDTASGGDRVCTITGGDIRGVHLNGQNAFKVSSGAGGSISSCSSGDELTWGNTGFDQFGQLILNSACTLMFTSNHTEYRVDRVELGGGAKLLLNEGDYWFDTLTMNQDSELELMGDVRLFVRSVSNITGAKINVTHGGEIILFGYDNVNLNGMSVFEGKVYSDARLTLNASSTINGRVTARYLEMNSSSAINDATSTPPSLSHYRIEFSSGALSCTGKDITIKACADDDCTGELSDSASVELTKDGGVYSNNVFSGSTSTQLWHTSGGTVTVGLGSTLPSGSYLCFIDGLEVANVDCTLDYADAGFIVDIPNELSNKPQQGLEITAVKISDTGSLCVPTFQGVSKTVNIWSDYISPGESGRSTSMSVFIDDIGVGQSSSAATPISLAFDNAGKAAFKLNYADAGRLELKISYVGVAGNEDEGMQMEGSDTFVRYPVGICLSPETICTAANKDCPGFRKAGEDFELSIQAMAWQSDGDLDFCDNLSTPNYVQSNISLSADLVAPADGVDGTTGLSVYEHTAQRHSLNLLLQSIDEVGIFSFFAAPPASYLGENILIPKAYSQAVGRFYPNDFKVYAYGIMPACMSGLFSYMDEPFRLNMSVRARNVAGETTENYFDDFASGAALLVAENSGDGIDFQARVSGMPSFTWTKSDLGVQDIDDDILFTRRLDGIADGPYPLLDIGLRILDDDGASIDAADMNAAMNDICEISNSCNAKRLSTQHLRHGRIVMENAYGPETDILRMPTTARFWQGDQWVVNTLDSCTRVMEPELPESTQVLYAPTLDGGQQVSRTNGAGNILASDFITGRYDLGWQSSVASPNRYRGQVTAPLAVPEWLQWYWSWDNDGALSNPRASAFFGSYRGHDKVIHWREVE